MAMDFFDRQDCARRQTTRLLALFAMAVAAIVVAIYFVAAAIVVANQPQTLATVFSHNDLYRELPQAQQAPVSFWQPVTLAWVALGTLAVIGLASLYKIAELSAGGASVAAMLGGRRVNPQTIDLTERRLLNVVEEMALASGVPVPPVYVLDGERGINAFAAGHQPGDAVVAVSAGCLTYLTREELQGVVGHEFSHVLNGDMRLNLRLIGVVYGILVLSIIGYYMVRVAGHSGGGRKNNGAILAVLLIGLALMILGYIGVFFGNIIKAAINRQREFLADASSVQFTRYPGGIAGALKKIGGLAEGSRIRDVHAEEISHMFFGDAMAGSFFNLFATHPPLADRIRAVEPDFDGRFPKVQPVAVAAEDFDSEQPPHATQATAWPIPGLPMPGFPLPAGAAGFAGALSAEGHAASPSRADGETAMAALDAEVVRLPPALVRAAREPFTAQSLIYAMLLSRNDETTRSRQWEMLEKQIEQPSYQQTQKMAEAIEPVSEGGRLRLVHLTVPALKCASPQQYAKFRPVVESLAAADGKIDLFEYCLRTVLFSYLDVYFGLKRPPAVRYRRLEAILSPLAVVLSTLAYAGHKDPAAARRAFQAGSQNLQGQAAMLPRPEATLADFDAALTDLAAASPKIKREVLSSVTACIAADRQVTPAEDGLLRAVAAALACPVPAIEAG